MEKDVFLNDPRFHMLKNVVWAKIPEKAIRSELVLIPETIKQQSFIIETEPTSLGNGLPAVELRTLAVNNQRLTLDEARLCLHLRDNEQ